MASSEIKLIVRIHEDNADDARLDKVTTQLMRDLRELDLQSINRLTDTTYSEGARGDPFTIGALTLAAAPVAIPSIISFLQHWLTTSRVVELETPNGVKLKFTPDKKYSEKEILSLVNKLNQIPAKKKKVSKEG